MRSAPGPPWARKRRTASRCQKRLPSPERTGMHQASRELVDSHVMADLVAGCAEERAKQRRWHPYG